VILPYMDMCAIFRTDMVTCSNSRRPPAPACFCCLPVPFTAFFRCSFHVGSFFLSWRARYRSSFFSFAFER